MEKRFLKIKLTKLIKTEFRDLCENLQNGIPFATPVFDGAKEKDVTEIIRISKITKLWSNFFMGW